MLRCCIGLEANKMIKLIMPIIIILFSYSPAGAQSVLGGGLEQLCGNCGVGEALDRVHDGIGNPLDIPGRVVCESRVETLGPVVGEAIRHSRNDIRAAGTARIPDEIKYVLSQFYSEEIFPSVRYKVGSSSEFNVAANAFRLGSDITAIALIDTVVFRSQQMPKTTAYGCMRLSTLSSFGSRGRLISARDTFGAPAEEAGALSHQRTKYSGFASGRSTKF